MLMPIGTFARASRLSVKALRNYDDSGLLPAVFVDPQSGYRYYRLEQLARADAIRSLRMVNMPLARIAETLDNDDSEQVLTSHLAALETQRDELDRMAQQLRRRIQRKEYVMSNEITRQLSPAMLVAAYRTTTTHRRIFDDIPAGFGKVMTLLGDVGVDPIGIPFTRYFQAPDAESEGDIAMCVPIAVGDFDVADHEGMDIVQIPETVTASVVHRGSYDDMGESYATVAAWVHEQGLDVVGPAREVYLNSPAEVTEDELLTEIHFPLGEGPLGDIPVEASGR